MKKKYLGVMVAGFATMLMGAVVFYLERDRKSNKVKSTPKPVVQEKKPNPVDKIQEFANLIPSGSEFLRLVDQLESDLHIGWLENAGPQESHVIWRCEYTMRCFIVLCEAGIKYLNSIDLDMCKMAFDSTYNMLVCDLITDLEQNTISINPLTDNQGNKIQFDGNDIVTLGQYFQYLQIRKTSLQAMKIFFDSVKYHEFEHHDQSAQLAM